MELWRGALRAGERKMLDELVAIYPHTITREELGERAGYTASGGTFGAYLSTLRRNGLVDVDGDAVRASTTLFLGKVSQRGAWRRHCQNTPWFDHPPALPRRMVESATCTHFRIFALSHHRTFASPRLQ